jgi:sn-glycerol 3-phosphate transport system ATP-binding protein
VSAIAVDKLTKAWGDTTAVDGISFEAPAGQFTVLLGPSGCGKSTMNIRFELRVPSYGRIPHGRASC